MSFADRLRAMILKPTRPTHVAVEVDLSAVPRPIDDEPFDIGKAARAAVRKKRKACEHTQVKIQSKTGREICTACGEGFPCIGDKCHHLDCIERGYQLGFRKGFPRDMPHSIMSTNVAEGHRSDLDYCPACALHPDKHYEYQVDCYEPPETWTTKIPLEPK